MVNFLGGFYPVALQNAIKTLYNVDMYSQNSKMMGKHGKRAVLIIVILVLVLGIAGFAGNLYVTEQTEDEIVGALDSHDDIFLREEVDAFKEIKPDCIMVLGASVHSDGTPSPMLKDRLDAGIALYKAKVAPKLLLTGDNGQVDYNEVEVMLQYAVANDVPEVSTYESVYRAKAIFEVKSMVVVTQRYHLFRALYGCRAMGIRALGASADQESYRGKEMREAREVLARDKDLLKWIVKPKPTFLGDKIPITGDGIQTQ